MPGRASGPERSGQTSAPAVLETPGGVATPKLLEVAMESYSIHNLTGNPSLDAMEIEDEMRADALIPFTGGIPDDVAAEMSQAFGWDEPPTEEPGEAEYANRRCDEEELLRKYPGLRDRTDQELITLIADPLPLPDADEVAAAAAILLERRLNGADRRIA